MSVLVSHPTGNANLRAVLRGLSAADLLQEFHTTIALPVAITERVARSSAGGATLAQRTFPEAGSAKVHSHSLREVVRQLAKRTRWSTLDKHESGWASVDAVYRSLDAHVARRLRRVSRSTVQAVYAYEDGAEQSFVAARDMGMKTLYDLPIAHWRTLRRLLSEEAERLPEWAPTMEGLRDSDAKLARKDAELALANRVFVASSFTRQSLVEHFGDELNIAVTPYGCPPPRVDQPARRAPGEPLRLIYAGHLAQRKGIADLIVGLDRLAIDWRLTLAGPRPAEAPAALDRFLADSRCDWLGVVPHASLLKRMEHHHVFVFPSIVEGFGMVITEAMAAGLPIVTTPHTAGPDIITEGREGFIVPIRDPDAIAERITRLADDETLRSEMAKHALETAAALSWQTYELQIASLVSEEIAS